MKISPYAAFLVAMMSASSAAQQCFTPSGTAVGTDGAQETRVDDRTNFSRRGSVDCPCSYAKAECKLADPVIVGDVSKFVITGNPGDDCSTIVINGEEAAAAPSYPEINIKQDISICNYNTDNKVTLSDSSKQVLTRFYYPVGDSQVNVSLENFNGQDLPSGQCLGEERDVVLPSKNVKSFMEAFLQGPQYTTSDVFIPNAFCYAYTFHRIDVGMFYPSLGECRMRTATRCELTDGTDCKDHINNNVDSCDLFTATFYAEACNDNDRIVQVQEGASNFKINSYERDANGKYKRIKQDLMPSIPGRSCNSLTHEREVNPCEKNFWQVNVEGKEFIAEAENNWHYKDKDCLSYTFDELPVFVPPGEPSVPSVPSPSTPSVPSVPSPSTPSVPTVPSPSPPSVPSVPSPSATDPTSPPKSKGKADGKAKQKTEDGEWEYVRRRRRG